MDIRNKVSLGIGLFSLSLSAIANQSLTPYFGFEAKQNNMQFRQNAGDGLVQTNYPQGNLFAGIKFNEYLALEFGYESTARKTRTTLVPAGANLFGRPSIGVLSKTTTKVFGPHANIVGFYPIFEEYCIDLFGSFGLANLKLNSQLVITVPPSQVPVTRFFSKRKTLPRVTLGVQHMINNYLGVRAMATWERTSSFGKINAKTGPLYMQPKDSRSLGAGVFYSF